MSRKVLRAQLEALNLTPRVDHILGKPILVFDEANHMVCGTVTSIGYAPKEGVSFRISSPSFYGVDIKKVVPNDDGTATVYSNFDELSWVCSFELIH